MKVYFGFSMGGLFRQSCVWLAVYIYAFSVERLEGIYFLCLLNESVYISWEWCIPA